MHAGAPENQIELLRQLVAALQAALEESRKENALLRQKIDALVRRVFGASSERVERGRLELLLQWAQKSETRAEEVAPVPMRASH